MSHLAASLHSNSRHPSRLSATAALVGAVNAALVGVVATVVVLGFWAPWWATAIGGLVGAPVLGALVVVLWGAEGRVGRRGTIAVRLGTAAGGCVGLGAAMAASIPGAQLTYCPGWESTVWKSSLVGGSVAALVFLLLVLRDHTWLIGSLRRSTRAAMSLVVALALAGAARHTIRPSPRDYVEALPELAVVSHPYGVAWIRGRSYPRRDLYDKPFVEFSLDAAGLTLHALCRDHRLWCHLTTGPGRNAATYATVTSPEAISLRRDAARGLVFVVTSEDVGGFVERTASRSGTAFPPSLTVPLRFVWMALSAVAVAAWIAFRRARDDGPSGAVEPGREGRMDTERWIHLADAPPRQAPAIFSGTEGPVVVTGPRPSGDLVYRADVVMSEGSVVAGTLADLTAARRAAHAARDALALAVLAMGAAPIVGLLLRGLVLPW